MQNRLLINGIWQDSLSSEEIEIINPANEEHLTAVPRGDAQDIDRAVKAANKAMTGPWAKMTPVERSHLLYKLAEALESHAAELAELETLNVGKPLRQARSDLRTSIGYYRYYAGLADKIQGDSIPLGPGYVNFTLLEPLGVTGHIIPWNFPISIASRSLAPALAAGNTAVIKPSEEAPLTILRLAEICLEVGFPEGVVNVVTGYGPEAGSPLVQHPMVRGITFTGSVPTGKAVLRLAADGVKPVVAELGGKNPQIVFPDADLEKAVADTIRGGLSNAGQVCSSSSRLILHSEIHDRFISLLREQVATLSLGPGIEDHDIGPLISSEHYGRVTSYISKGVSEGASLLLGGTRPQQLKSGYFIEPSIFDQVNSNMAIAQEEIFGPVLCILSFDSEQEAVNLANSVSYGLVAGIYTQDINRAFRLARNIQAGQVWINDWFIGGVGTPFGGYKESGLGREKGIQALMNYVQIKNLGIRISTS